MSDLAAYQEAVRELVARRAPGWQLRFKDALPDDEPFMVVLEHPLSAGCTRSVTNRELADGDLSALEVWVGTPGRFGSYEIHDISHAPDHVPNAFLLHSMRQNARRFEWSQAECRVIAGYLWYVGDCLTREEAEWFANFTGTDAPHEYPEEPWPDREELD